jgi:hypothetical protein
MRKWVKYFNERSLRGKVFRDKSSAPEDHSKDMGGYDTDVSYKNKDDFFSKWYVNLHYGRLPAYNQFIQTHVDKKDKILSLASGRCAGELYLLEQGYDIACSDLKELNIHSGVKKLFPQFRFFPLDILRPSLQEKYDAIAALSLIYAFDDNELKLFFENTSNSLNAGGCLIIDPSGSSDNRITAFMDEVFLKYETYLKRIILFSLGIPSAFVAKHHGFRRTDQEIVDIAKDAGFELIVIEYSDFLMEFRRSRFLGELLERSDWVKKAISIIGKKTPYIRLFKFELIAK